MPEPLKGNLNFEARHNIYNADYSMKAMMACRTTMKSVLLFPEDEKSLRRITFIICPKVS